MDKEPNLEPVSSDSSLSDDSNTDFEEKIRRLMNTDRADDTPQGTRRSERRKKPSSWWTKEAGFVPLPPRSSKKKGKSVSPPPPEGTSTAPLFIADWGHNSRVE